MCDSPSPRSSPACNGVPSQWRSYISRVDSPDPDATPVPPATPAAEQKPTEFATFENAVATIGGTPCTSTGGVFTVLGGGQYRYTFSKGLTEYSGVSYDPSETQRAGLQVRGDATCAPGANSDKLLELTPQALVTNGVYDFVPGGGLPATPDIIDPAQCNACHVRLSAHGGGRTDFAFCVTCHNPYTVQSATNTSFDMMFMAHQIHMDGNLATPFPIWEPGSGGQPGTMEYPFADVTYPQDIRNCLTCHNDSASGSAWKTAITIANCTSCHDTTTFTGPNPTHGGGPASEDQCTNCHLQSNLPQLSVNGAHAMSVQAPLLPSTPSVREYGNRFKFEILSVDATSFAPGAFPRFTFRITDPTNGNAPYNIYNSPYFSGRSHRAGVHERHRAARVRHRLEHRGHQQCRQRLRSRAADFAEPVGRLSVCAGDFRGRGRERRRFVHDDFVDRDSGHRDRHGGRSASRATRPAISTATACTAIASR